MKHGTKSGYDYYGCRCLDCTAAAMRYRRRGLPDGDPRHGSTNGYGNYGCRCDACREAHGRALTRRKKALAARGLAPGDPRHGTDNGYATYRCRCDACTAAHARDNGFTRGRREQGGAA